MRGLAALRRIRRRAAPLRDPDLRREVGRLARMLLLDPTRIRLRTSTEVGSPGTWRIVRPVILLPPGVVGAPTAVRRSVVLHELLHVRRRAWGVQLLALVVCALHWFNPLAWRARRALLAGEEEAVDEAVVRAGVPREVYGGHLLEVVRSLRPLRAPGAAAVLLAEGRSLEARVRTLLRSGDRPPPPSRSAAAAVVLALGVGSAAVVSVEARSPTPGGAQEPVANASKPLIQGGAAGAQRTGDVLVAGGTLIVQGEPRRLSDILLSETDGGLVVEAIGEPGTFQATDTIDVAGLYIHRAHAFLPGEPFQVGGPAMYVVRTGPSQGHPARMLISPRETEQLEPSANYPEGPAHEAVGCYSVERGAWDPPPSRPAQERLPVPEAVQLHWQYLLHLGREQVLAATDGDGEVPVNANVFAWAPADGDSIRISVTEVPPGYGSVMFRLGRDGNGYGGTVSLPPHAVDGSPFPQASARLVPTSCTAP